MATRPRKKANHYRSLNTVVQHQQPPNNIHSPLSARLNVTHRAHPPVSGSSLLLKTTSNSIADLSLSMHQQKISSATIRLSSFQSKLDQCNADSYKKVPLSQSFDWGMLAITNANLILLYNKEKSSLVIFDAHGHENEVRFRKKDRETISRSLHLANSMVRWRNQRSGDLSRR